MKMTKGKRFAKRMPKRFSSPVCPNSSIAEFDIIKGGGNQSSFFILYSENTVTNFFKCMQLKLG